MFVTILKCLTAKTSSTTLSRCSPLLKLPILITFQISFSFNQDIISLQKANTLALFVFNQYSTGPFLRYSTHRKTQLHEHIFKWAILNLFLACPLTQYLFLPKSSIYRLTWRPDSFLRMVTSLLTSLGMSVLVHFWCLAAQYSRVARFRMR